MTGQQYNDLVADYETKSDWALRSILNDYTFSNYFHRMAAFAVLKRRGVKT